MIGISKMEAYGYSIDMIMRMEQQHPYTPDSTEAGCRKLFNETKTEIETDLRLQLIAVDFKLLRFLTGINIKMFDFDAAKKLQYKEGVPHPY